MNYKNRNNSFNDTLIKQAQEWLRERDLFWQSAETTQEIRQLQSALHQHHDQHYDKRDIGNIVRRLANVLVMMYLTLNEVPKKFLWEAVSIIDHILDGPFDSVFIYKEALGIANAKILTVTNGEISGAAENVLDTIGSVCFVFDKKPTVKVMQAVQNAVREYALGQDAACIVSCRTAIELALKEKISCVMSVKYRRSKKINSRLSTLLVIAAKKGVLTDTTKKLADNVRGQANKICHEDTSLAQNVGRIFYETCRVICTLYTGRDPLQPRFSAAEWEVMRIRFITKYPVVQRYLIKINKSGFRLLPE